MNNTWTPQLCWFSKNSVKIIYRNISSNVWSTLYFFHRFSFSLYFTDGDIFPQNKSIYENKIYLDLLIKRKNGSRTPSVNYILNLSNYNLSDTDKLILSRGVDFLSPLRKLIRLKLSANMSVLFPIEKMNKQKSNNIYRLLERI